MRLTITKLEIPFKQTFAHATAIRSCTEGVLVKAESANGVIGVGEGCPRKYVTGETIQTATRFFNVHRQTWEKFRSLEDLKAWLVTYSQRIDINPASWCAVELALFDCWGQEQGQSIEALLNLKKLTGKFHYSAVLGTENVAAFESKRNNLRHSNFSILK